MPSFIKTLYFTYFYELEYVTFTHSNPLIFPLQLLFLEKRNRGVYDCIHLILQKSCQTSQIRHLKESKPWQHVVQIHCLLNHFSALMSTPYALISSFTALTKKIMNYIEGKINPNYNIYNKGKCSNGFNQLQITSLFQYIKYHKP